MSIKEKSREIKGVLSTFLSSRGYLALLMALTGTISFSLGILFEREEAKKNIPQIEVKGGVEVSSLQQNTFSGVVASKSGTKYHLPDCPGAQQIKKENLIYFDTREEAENAGYSKATNCPGL